MSTIYTGHIFTGTADVAEAVAVEGSLIVAVGSLQDVQQTVEENAQVIQCDGLILPAFVDSHVHLHMHGEAAARADLVHAHSWDDIQAELTKWMRENPDTPRVLGRSWIHHMLQGQEPTRQMLDDVSPDRPCYLDSADYHSVWVNSAALAELGIDSNTADPKGGHIHRDDAGNPSGLLDETVVTTIVWPFLATTRTDHDRDEHLRRAISDLHAAGVTTAVDMAVDEDIWASFLRVQASDGPQLRIGAHWMINPSLPLEQQLGQVARAAETAQQNAHHPLLVSRGIKIVVDGVIDGCTAALSEPYANGAHPGPIWDHDSMVPIIRAAEEAGLSVAMHAIGDLAVSTALDALETVLGPKPRAHRHRIEHLEYTTPGTAQRCADLGVIVSMQPVHADPYIMQNWRELLGPKRAERGFAWPEYLAAGCRLALGTDTPTAPHHALPNLWVATTRRSAFDPELPPNNAAFAISVPSALEGSTRTGAFANNTEHVGALRAGMSADLIILDRDPLTDGPDALLHGRVMRTMILGDVVHDLL